MTEQRIEAMSSSELRTHQRAVQTAIRALPELAAAVDLGGLEVLGRLAELAREHDAIVRELRRRLSEESSSLAPVTRAVAAVAAGAGSVPRTLVVRLPEGLAVAVDDVAGRARATHAATIMMLARLGLEALRDQDQDPDRVSVER